MAAGFEDPYLTCPLDEVHRIRKSRMQCHLTRCLKNHKLTDKIKCPFNPLHIIYPNEMAHHMTVCESNASVDLQMYDRNDQKCFSGIISEQDAMAQLEAALGASSNEVEYNHTIDKAGYDPVKANLDNPVFRTLNCESKAKRREFRLQERKRIAAIEAEQGKRLVKPATPDHPQKLQELNPIRSLSVVANFDAFRDEPQEQEFPIDNYPPVKGIMCEEHDLGKRFTNGHAPLANEKDKTSYQNSQAVIDDLKSLSVQDNTDISTKIELLRQQENEIRQKILELEKQATRSDESKNKNPFRNLNNDMSVYRRTNPFTVPINDSHDFEGGAVNNSTDVKQNYSDVLASKPQTFELSARPQSSPWNGVSSASKDVELKPSEAFVVKNNSSTEETIATTQSSEWTIVSRSKKAASVSDSTSRNVKTKSRDPSPVTESNSLKKVVALKETLAPLKSTPWNVGTNSRDPSPTPDAEPWNKVATLKETSSKSDSMPWSVMTRSKKISSSEQCTQWRLAPSNDTLKVSSSSLSSSSNATAVPKMAGVSQLPPSDGNVKPNETLPAPAAAASTPTTAEVVSRFTPLQNSNKKLNLVSTSVSSMFSSSTYSKVAKGPEKPVESSLSSSKTNAKVREFLPIPRRPAAGRGIIHALDEIRQQKLNELFSSRISRPGSRNSFCSSYEQNIDGVYGFEETV
ncbi:uncharacterized protein LOC130676266 [Microplitis mediator]|uniref:uncharacterized protein LOC130676266 n=1 Tax=Microplitis mediator TaxID=375433 RepID=UPI0025524B1A|nr:uncharacterized protein LOC130676266 [Microplitis mediator]